MHLLERARTARGWTRTELARRLCVLGATRGVAVGTGKDGVWRWEHGRDPDHPTRVLIAELLGIPDDAVTDRPWPNWLAADPALQPLCYTWDAPGALQSLNEVSGSDMDIDRRTFALVTGATLTTSLWSWLTADPAAAGQIAEGRRIGEAAVAHIERQVRELRHTDDADGGGQVIQETQAAMGMVVRLLQDRSYTETHGQRLYSAAADLARMHAWAVFDVQSHCPDAVFESALRCAHAASDTILGSHILAFWCAAAYNCGRPDDAEAMAAASVSAARGRTTPKVEAMLLTRRARARAHQRDATCFRDLDQATELLATSATTGDTDPEWAYWFDQSELLAARASCELDLDRAAQAETTFAQAAALYPADRVRTHALYLTRQADAQWRQNDLERACATANRALDLTEEISSHRTTGPLRDLAAKMLPHAATPVVRDFRDRVATSLHVA
ncbi:helix-turn-helix transcriptional regulator [Streptomyces sp. NPDC005722]